MPLGENEAMKHKISQRCKLLLNQGRNTNDISTHGKMFGAVNHQGKTPPDAAAELPKDTR